MSGEGGYDDALLLLRVLFYLLVVGAVVAIAVEARGRRGK